MKLRIVPERAINISRRLGVEPIEGGMEGRGETRLAFTGASFRAIRVPFWGDGTGHVALWTSWQALVLGTGDPVPTTCAVPASPGACPQIDFFAAWRGSELRLLAVQSLGSALLLQSALATSKADAGHPSSSSAHQTPTGQSNNNDGNVLKCFSSSPKFQPSNPNHPCPTTYSSTAPPRLTVPQSFPHATVWLSALVFLSCVSNCASPCC